MRLTRVATHMADREDIEAGLECKNVKACLIRGPLSWLNQLREDSEACPEEVSCEEFLFSSLVRMCADAPL